jgi:hypothetical protein
MGEPAPAIEPQVIIFCPWTDLGGGREYSMCAPFSVFIALTFFLLPRAACPEFRLCRIIRLVDTNSGRIVNEIKGHKGKVSNQHSCLDPAARCRLCKPASWHQKHFHVGGCCN